MKFAVYRHPTESWARIELPDQSIVLREGEWSKWHKLNFPVSMPSFLPDDEVSGVVRFYLQQVRPEFRLYMSPINIDPSDPGDQKISEPQDFVSTISGRTGPLRDNWFPGGLQRPVERRVHGG